MQDFFKRIEDFVASAKSGAADYAEKAAVSLEELAAWVRAQSAGIGAAHAPTQAFDTARVNALRAELVALAAPGAVPAGASAAIGDGRLVRIVQLILSLLDGITTTP